MSRSRRVLIAVPVIVFGLWCMAGFMLSLGKDLTERHEPYPYPAFDFSSGGFADYIAHTRSQLQAARLDGAPAEVLANLLPFELEPAADCARDANGRVERGVVLVHGLFDSPYSMRPFGEDLRARCMHVLGVLLQGHGTRPGDFLQAQWEDWAALTRFAASELAQRANTVILSGHSAGGALALLDALQYPQADALILFAPALAITPSAKYAKYVTPFGQMFAGAAWFEVGTDDAPYRYESITFSAAAEMQALIDTTWLTLNGQARQLPVFTVASMEDSTVGIDAILDYMGGNTHPDSRTLLYSQHGVDAGANMEVLASSLPDQRVLSLSHLGLMTPPSHPWYGRDGAWRNCGHYGDDDPLFVQCKQGMRDWYGEITPENRAQGVLERIAFNPFYDDMLARLDAFLLALSN